MAAHNPDILVEVADYYSARLAEHGATARGVDWNGEESQVSRFEQLAKVIDLHDKFSINDLGCGYGALFEFLAGRFSKFSYRGFDVSERMVSAGKDRLADRADASVAVGSVPAAPADFGIASGIFNVRLGRSDEEWERYIHDTLDILDSSSKRGFAFNCLTSYSDPDRIREYLYYADPAALFDLCMRRYSRHVALLHDYKLFEFTILVRKQP